MQDAAQRLTRKSQEWEAPVAPVKPAPDATGQQTPPLSPRQAGRAVAAARAVCATVSPASPLDLLRASVPKLLYPGHLQPACVQKIGM